jgi:hypothetical protein
MSFSLVSVSALDLQGCYTLFGGGKCIIMPHDDSAELAAAMQGTDSSRALITATLRRKLYHVDADSFEEARMVPAASGPAVVRKPAAVVPYTFASNRSEIKGSQGSVRPGMTEGLNPLQLLHMRTGHTSEAALLEGLRKNACKGAQTTYAACKGLKVGPCEPCMMGHMRADSISTSRRDYDALLPMQEIGMDPVPLSHPTHSGFNVLNFAVDYGTKMMWVEGAESEKGQADVVRAIQRDLATPYGHEIRVVHTDNGSVFLNHQFKRFCLDEGILHDVSAPYLHQHNLVEGTCIRVILNRACVLLADSGLSTRFVEYAVQEAVQGWNAMLHPAAAATTPFERVTGEKPDISGFRPFGAVAYYFNDKKVRELSADPRWQEKASKGILLGRAPGVKGAYLVYPGRNRKVLVRQQVVVLEAKAAALLPCYSDRHKLGDPVVAGDSAVVDTIQQADQREQERADATPVSHGTRSKKVGPVDARTLQPQPVGGDDYYWSDPSCAVTRASAGVDSRRAAVETACLASSTAAAMACSALSEDEREEEMLDCILQGRQLPANPRCIAEALRSAHAVEWREALDRELGDCLSGNSYAEVDERPVRYMNSVMAFRVSMKADGTLKFRVRLCPNGSRQVKGEDFDESYSPTVRKETIFALFHVAAHNDWEIWHIDIACAYKEAIPHPTRRLFMRMSKDVVQFGFSAKEFVELLVNYWGTKDAGRKFSGWPELKVATSMLASAGATPQKVHRRGAMKLLQYIKEHREGLELVLGGKAPVVLFAFSDASYTPEGDSRYQYGFAEYLGPSAGAVSVYSKRSTTVSHSSAQSEIKAMSETCKSIAADRVMLAMLGEPQEAPTKLYTDSMAGVDLVGNVFQMHPKCRHFNRDINYVRECVQMGLVELVFVSTDDNPADILTKVLGETKHVKFTGMLLRGVSEAAMVVMDAVGRVLC